MSGADVRKNREWCKPMSSERISRYGKWIPYGTYRARIELWKRFAEVIEVKSSYWDTNGRMELDTTRLGYSTRHLNGSEVYEHEVLGQRLLAWMNRPEDVEDVSCQRYIRLSG